MPENLPNNESNLPTPEKELPEHGTKPEVDKKQSIHPFHHSKAKTITLILILSLFSIGLAATAIFLNKSMTEKKITDFESCAAAGNPIMESYPARCMTKDGKSFTQKIDRPVEDPTSQPLISEDWKTYTNPTYRFSFQYPEYGMVVNSEGQMSEGVCGGAIEQQYMSTYPYILGVDNYFNITAQPFNGTIEQYINSYGVSSLYNTTPITVAGATEAIEINKKPNADPQDLMKSPFANTTRIYKKGNNIFTIMLLQNPGNTNGCVPHDNISINDVLTTFRFDN